MRTRRFLAIFTVAALSSVSAVAADHSSAEDQMACTPDVYRLCGQYIPDEDSIVSCLKSNVRLLSPACHKVMTRPSPKGGSDTN